MGRQGEEGSPRRPSRGRSRRRPRRRRRRRRRRSRRRPRSRRRRRPRRRKRRRRPKRRRKRRRRSWYPGGKRPKGVHKSKASKAAGKKIAAAQKKKGIGLFATKT